MKALAFIDIEATSADAQNADIIEIAFLIKNEEGEIIDHFHSLVKPARKIPDEIVALTGITNQMAQSAPEFFDISERIKTKLKGSRLVAHKADFDHDILRKKFGELGVDFQNKTYCTLKAAQKLAPEMKSYSLAALCRFSGIPLKKNHRAQEDAEAVAQLYDILSLMEGRRSREQVYLEKHKKVIARTRPIPGIVAFKNDGGEVFFQKAVDDLQKELKERLALKRENKTLLGKNFAIETTETGSFARAMLYRSQEEKKPAWSIYSFKNKKGELIVRCGKTIPKKPALLYFHSKGQAMKVLKRITKAGETQSFAYRESPDNDKSEIVKRNALLKEEIRKLKPAMENLLIRSRYKIEGRFQYILIQGKNRYALFEREEELSSSEDLASARLSFKPMRPSSRRALELSLQYIKNQKNKTDIVTNIKRPS